MARIDEFFKFSDFFAVFHLDRGQFDDLVVLSRQTRRFRIEHDVSRMLQFFMRFVVRNRLTVFNNVCLNAVQNLDTVFLPCRMCFRKGLQRAVIGNSNRFLPPLGSLCDKVRNRIRRIHHAHVGVQMKLNALFIFRSRILSSFMLDFIDVIGIDDKISHVAVFLDVSFDFDPLADFDGIKHRFIFGIVRKLFDGKRRSIIGNLKRQNFSAGAQFAHLGIKDVALDDHNALFFYDRLHRSDLGFFRNLLADHHRPFNRRKFFLLLHVFWLLGLLFIRNLDLLISFSGQLRIVFGMLLLHGLSLFFNRFFINIGFDRESWKTGILIRRFNSFQNVALQKIAQDRIFSQQFDLSMIKFRRILQEILGKTVCFSARFNGICPIRNQFFVIHYRISRRKMQSCLANRSERRLDKLIKFCKCLKRQDVVCFQIKVPTLRLRMHFDFFNQRIGKNFPVVLPLDLFKQFFKHGFFIESHSYPSFHLKLTYTILAQ